MYLQKLGRRKDAELVRLALGLSIGRGNDQVELMEDKATESGMGERLSNTVEDHSTLWSVPLLFKGAAETPQGDKIPSVGAFFTMVMEASGFSLMCRELLEELTEEKKRILLGVDTEHRPEGLYCGELKGFSHSYPLSLLQLATLRRVWLVDLLSIEKNGGVGEEYSKMFCDEILGRSQFVKVGWGIRDDFRRLFHSHGHWLSVGRTATSHVTASACGGGGSGTTGGTAGGTEGMKVEGVVDLAAVARLCFTPAPNSLSSLIQLSLGHPLCKKMQTSDWQLRPLSWEQLKYAALDALSSVHACERLQKEHIYKDGWGGEKSGVMLGETHFFSSCSQSATPPPTFSPILYSPIPRSPPLATPADVAQALVLFDVSPVEALRFVEHTEAVETDTPPPLLINSLALLTRAPDGETPTPALAILPASTFLDLSSFQGGNYRLATRAECPEFFGYHPGSFPPISVAYPPLGPEPLKVFIDFSLRDACSRSGGKLVGGGGSSQYQCHLTFQQLLRLNPVHAIESISGGMKQQNNQTLRTTGEVVGRVTSAEATNTQGLGTDDTNASLLPLPPPRFLCDSSLGRLTRWLRVVGVDAENRVGWGGEARLVQIRGGGGGSTSASAGLTSQEFVDWANESGRILLTRDAKVLAKNCCSFFIEANDCAAQFVALCDALAIKVTPEDLMSRCARCNNLGYVELTPDEAREKETERPPEKVLQKLDRFWGCPRCGKVYWEGAKFDETREKYSSIFPS